MAKPRVEKAPAFSIESVDYGKIEPYLQQYDVTDHKGRYLHWSQLKWRVPKNNAEDIWQAIKLKRSLQMQIIELHDVEGEPFTYFTPHTLEAKLHSIVEMSGNNVASITEKFSSDSIQRKFLVSSLMMEEAITSAQLEGAATTREVAKKMLEEGREPVDEDERMILNNYFLLKYAESISQEALSIDLILEFHRIATTDTHENNVIPGEFRNDNDIYVEDRGESVYQPPDYQLIPERLEKLCAFANAEHDGKENRSFIAPVVKAIILHFMVGYEHPFRDGNGRTARALFYWFMLKHGYELFRYVSISKLLKADPKGYGLAYLYTEKDQNDLTYFIDYQLNIILKAFDELQRYLQTKAGEFYQIVESLEGSSFGGQLNFIQKDLIKKGVKEPGRVFTVKEVASSYEVSENSARTYLNKLVDLKLLLQAKEGRTVLYFVPSDLRGRLGCPH